MVTTLCAKKSYLISNSIPGVSQNNHCNNATMSEKLLLYTDYKPGGVIPSENSGVLNFRRLIMHLVYPKLPFKGGQVLWAIETSTGKLCSALLREKPTQTLWENLCTLSSGKDRTAGNQHSNDLFPVKFPGVHRYINTD